jgi:hypothetical protein
VRDKAGKGAGIAHGRLYQLVCRQRDLALSAADHKHCFTHKPVARKLSEARRVAGMGRPATEPGDGRPGGCPARQPGGAGTAQRGTPSRFDRLLEAAILAAQGGGFVQILVEYLMLPAASNTLLKASF